MNPATFDSTVNPVFWIFSNVLVAYISVVLLVFVVFYGTQFYWWKKPHIDRVTGARTWTRNSSGVSIFTFVTSLLGVIALVAISLFINPRQPWYEYPPDVFVWRPVLRAAVYLAVAIASTNLLVVAVKRWLSSAPVQAEVDPRTRNPLR